MKKRLLAALMAATMTMSLAACGGSDTASTGGSDTASQDGPYKIRMTLKTNAAEFWNIIQAGAEAYEKEHPAKSSFPSMALRERPTTRSSSTLSRPIWLQTMTAT